MKQDFFQTTKPIDRDSFISTFKESIELATLLTCPFGLSDQLRLIIHEEYLHNEYLTLYKSWEEMLARRVYAFNGISDDQVAATLHHYVTDQPDHEVIQLIQSATDYFKNMFELNAVEYPSIPSNLLSPQIAAKLIISVFDALQECFANVFNFDHPIMPKIDAEIKNKYGITVIDKPLYPSDFNSILFGDKCFSSKAMQCFKNCLYLPEFDLKLSIEQYFMLISHFNSDSQVLSAVNDHLHRNGKSFESFDMLSHEFTVIPTCNPTISLMLQLRVMALKEEEYSNDIESNIQLTFLEHIIQLKERADDAYKLQKFKKAKGILSRISGVVGLTLKEKSNESDHDSLSDEDGDSESDDVSTKSDNENVFSVPKHLQIELLLQNAMNFISLHKYEEALPFCNRVLELDPRNSLAYKCRSEIYMVEIEDNKNSDNTFNAANDSLAAFVLGGASDVSLAATAEEAIRESCRDEGKEHFQQQVTIFRQRQREMVEALKEHDSDVMSALEAKFNTLAVSEVEVWSPPQMWLIKSYFSGYELLSDTFTILPYLLTRDIVIPNTSSVSNSMDIDDIYTESTKLNLLPVPSHLLDKNDENEPVEKPNDMVGYDILRKLVEIFDHLNDEKPKENCNSKISEISLQINSSQESVLKMISKLHEESVEFVDMGIAEYRCVFSEELTNDASTESPFEQNPVEEALKLLRTSNVVNLTGVKFSTSTGEVVTVLPSHSRKSVESKDEDGEDCWEDCDESDADSDEISVVDDLDESISSTVSSHLRARLLNICSSVCYLCGDSTGAVECLRVAIKEDPDLSDSYLKLGALLIDMDERKEAKSLLESVLQQDPANPFVLLHLAELYIHDNDFEEASAILQQASSFLSSILPADEAISTVSPVTAASRQAHTLVDSYTAKCPSKQRTQQLEYSRMLSSRRLISVFRIHANLICLRGVSSYRLDPSHPDNALRILRRGLTQYRRVNEFNTLPVHEQYGLVNRNSPQIALYIALCLGEITSQTGDIIAAIKLFQLASDIDPSNPLPYTNASRAYQQLNLHSAAEKHLYYALELDPSLAMTRVDIAQHLSLQGKSHQALELLEDALKFAKHASEIRDVLTARTVTRIQVKLQDQGVYFPPMECFHYECNQVN